MILCGGNYRSYGLFQPADHHCGTNRHADLIDNDKSPSLTPTNTAGEFHFPRLTNSLMEESPLLLSVLSMDTTGGLLLLANTGEDQ